MSTIIEAIEKAQMKEHVDQFNVGDTVKVYAKIKEGDKESFRIIFERNAPVFLAFAWRLLRDADVTENNPRGTFL